MRKFFAESLGTFALSLVVLMAMATATAATPWLVGLTLGLFVYSIGNISGTHINPAVTVGAWSLGKISGKNALGYVVSQFLGAGLAMLVMSLFAPGLIEHLFETAAQVDLSAKIFFAEVLGMFFFAFGIASVMYKKVPSQLSGLVVGLSLTLGAIMVGPISGGVLNPAVALVVGEFNWVYLLAPIVGSVLGMQSYRMLANEK